MSPVLYIPHGAGPLPLLNDPSQAKLTHFLQTIPKKLGTPKAILMLSAHYESSIPSLTGDLTPKLIYDYSGFPSESYTITYPAKGSLELSQKVKDLLSAQKIISHIDPHRGYDHGMFVPLKLMYPQADIPVVQLSLANSLDPTLHVNIGEALRPLRKEDVLIIGSGLSFHNMRAFFTPSMDLAHGTHFDTWLQHTLQEADYARAKEKLIHWKNAPEATFAHPREEHLLPLHVCFGAAQSVAHIVFDDIFMHAKVSGFLWN